MAKIDVKKIRIFGLSNEKKSFLKRLQKEGIVQIISKEESKKTKDEIQTLIYKTEIILDMFSKKMKEGMLSKFKPRYVEESKFFNEKEIEVKRDIIDRIWELLKEKEDLNASLADKKSILLEIEPWSKLDINTSEIKENTYICSFLGKFPEKFYKEASEKGLFNKYEVSVLSIINGIVYVFVITLKDDKQTFIETFKNYGFEEYNADKDTNFSESYSKIKKEMIEIEKRIIAIDKSIDSYIEKIDEIRLFYDFIYNYYKMVEVDNNLEYGVYTFSVYAWIPEIYIKNLEAIIKDYKYIDYELIPLEEKEVAPVFVKNGYFSEAFEFVTAMYSYPGKNDVDPTPFLAPFFALFVGFCLTDAGYGLMLFLVTLFALKKLNLPDNMRKLTKILNFSGIATIIIGLLTGGVFGIDVSLLSEANPIRKFIESVRILDTNKDIMLFLGIALLLGYIHVLFGYFINFFHKIKNKDVKIAILDVLPWIMIMLGAAGIVKFALTSVKDIFYSIGLFLMLLGAGIILLFSGRDFKNPVLRLINGLYGLYGATGIFGDILSYARLFALGIATGIIGGVINKLSSALLGNISFSSITAGISSLISIILFSAILIAGQIFNIVINTLGGFIHTMRLQFVEFFTKFFEGGGEVFKPLRLGLKYFLIKKEKTEEEKC